MLGLFDAGLVFAKSAGMQGPMSLGSGGEMAGAEIANKRLTDHFLSRSWGRGMSPSRNSSRLSSSHLLGKGRIPLEGQARLMGEYHGFYPQLQRSLRLGEIFNLRTPLHARPSRSEFLATAGNIHFLSN